MFVTFNSALVVNAQIGFYLSRHQPHTFIGFFVLICLDIKPIEWDSTFSIH